MFDLVFAYFHMPTFVLIMVNIQSDWSIIKVNKNKISRDYRETAILSTMYMQLISDDLGLDVSTCNRWIDPTALK